MLEGLPPCRRHSQGHLEGREWRRAPGPTDVAAVGDSVTKSAPLKTTSLRAPSRASACPSEHARGGEGKKAGENVIVLAGRTVRPRDGSATAAPRPATPFPSPT